MATRKQFIKSAFSKLRLDTFEIIGSADQNYNCIAWAAEDTSRVWWPGLAYWPAGVPEEVTLSAFVEAFGTLGYLPCDSGEPEPGFEKVAIYIKSGKPTHASKQLQTGRWTSKLGRSELIEHDLDALEGDAYGHIAQILRRPRRES